MNRAIVWLKSWFVFNRNIVAKYSVQNIRCNLEKLLKIVSRETSFHPENLTAYCTVYSVQCHEILKLLYSFHPNWSKCVVMVSFWFVAFKLWLDKAITWTLQISFFFYCKYTKENLKYKKYYFLGPKMIQKTLLSLGL